MARPVTDVATSARFRAFHGTIHSDVFPLPCLRIAREVSETREALSFDLIIDTAREIADAEGLDAASLSRVAREIGSSQPALYRHVGSHPELVRALGLQCRELLAARLTDAAAGLAGDDALAAMARAWRGLVKDHPGAYAATDRYPCAGDSELEAAVQKIVDVLSLALLAYDLTDEQRIDAARTIRSALHGFSHLETGDGHPLDQDLDASFDALVGLLCRGVKTMPD